MIIERNLAIRVLCVTEADLLHTTVNRKSSASSSQFVIDAVHGKTKEESSKRITLSHATFRGDKDISITYTVAAAHCICC